MPKSQNGYSAPITPVNRSVPGGVIPLRAGPTGDLLAWFARQWHARVEPLRWPGNWGYAYRDIRGSSTTLSNHASGTACDLNAPAHPLGTQPRSTLTQHKIDTIHAILREAGGCIRWGGDYTGRKDSMHAEIIVSEARCAEQLRKLSGGATTAVARNTQPRTMYDSVTAAHIPASAQMVAGYVSGPYAWKAADWNRFPHAVKVRIATQANVNNGHVLDSEPGDATPAQCPGWVLMRRRAGVDPTIYCPEVARTENGVTYGWSAVREAFRRAGVKEPHYWIARYNGVKTLYDGQAVAKQYLWDNHPYYSGGHYDVSHVAPYWPGVDAAGASAVDELEELLMDPKARAALIEDIRSAVWNSPVNVVNNNGKSVKLPSYQALREAWRGTSALSPGIPHERGDGKGFWALRRMDADVRQGLAVLLEAMAAQLAQGDAQSKALASEAQKQITALRATGMPK